VERNQNLQNIGFDKSQVEIIEPQVIENNEKLEELMHSWNRYFLYNPIGIPESGTCNAVVEVEVGNGHLIHSERRGLSGSVDKRRALSTPQWS
jgi:hypothetical protein